MDKNKLKPMWVATITDIDRTWEGRSPFFANDQATATDYAKRVILGEYHDYGVKLLDLWRVSDVSRDLYIAGSILTKDLQPYYS